MNPVGSFLAGCALFFAGSTFSKDPPNIILIVADDLGYRDLSCCGAKDFKTPHLDSIAESGVRLTSFYAAASIGSPSRAAMLTGRYPARMGFNENPKPRSKEGLSPGEWTLAEALKSKNYKTACFGKWGLGDDPKFLPKEQGFDEYFGVPFSNDAEPPIPLIDSTSQIEENPDQRNLTKRYTDQSVRFIREHKSEPFFLYLAYHTPHVPLFVSETFSGSASYGLFGDAMQELDGSVGEILKTLDENKLSERTIVIFTSDNGPNLAAGAHGGNSDPLRDGKGTRYEGGHRVPCVIRWPGGIPEGKVLPGIVAGIDFLPTILKASGVEIPKDARKIDGIDVMPYLTGKVKQSPRRTFFYSLWSVRQGKWKLMLPGGYREEFPRPKVTYKPGMMKYEHSRLFDLETDIREQNSQHEDEDHVELLKKLAEMCFDFQAELK